MFVASFSAASGVNYATGGRLQAKPAYFQPEGNDCTCPCGQVTAPFHPALSLCTVSALVSEFLIAIATIGASQFASSHRMDT